MVVDDFIVDLPPNQLPETHRHRVPEPRGRPRRVDLPLPRGRRAAVRPRGAGADDRRPGARRRDAGLAVPGGLPLALGDAAERPADGGPERRSRRRWRRTSRPSVAASVRARSTSPTASTCESGWAPGWGDTHRGRHADHPGPGDRHRPAGRARVPGLRDRPAAPPGRAGQVAPRPDRGPGTVRPWAGVGWAWSWSRCARPPSGSACCRRSSPSPTPRLRGRLAGSPRSGPVPVAVGVALGQTVGKVLLFLGVRRGQAVPVRPARAGAAPPRARSARPGAGCAPAIAPAAAPGRARSAGACRSCCSPPSSASRRCTRWRCWPAPPGCGSAGSPRSCWSADCRFVFVALASPCCTRAELRPTGVILIAAAPRSA